METKRLIDKVQEAAGNEKYKKLKGDNETPKIVIGLGRSVLGNVLGFTHKDWFFDPKICIESQLKWKLLWHEEIQDDTIIDTNVDLDYGVALEPSLFGMEALFKENEDPWYGQPIIKERNYLEKLELPDFYKSGIMPQVHRQYQGMQELLKGELPVQFPGWARGPWSVACMLRGFTELYLDLIEDPEFVHKLMQFIVDARIEFEKQRCKFLGIQPQDSDYLWRYVVYRPTTNSDQYNDEVDGNLFSADTYREFILPYEKQLAEFYHGVGYYHSCGNMTKLFKDLATIPNLGKLHVSQTSDLKTAIEAGGYFKIEKTLDPYSELLSGSNEHIEGKLETIKEAAKGQKVEIWADAIYVGGRDTVEKAQNLVRIFRKVFYQ